MALRNKLQTNGCKNTCYAVLTAHRVQAVHLQKDTFNILRQLLAFFMMCKKSKVCVSPSFPQQALLPDFGTKAPLLSAAAQNYSTPKPELPLEGLSASSPWVGARAGGWAAVTDRPKSETSRTSNDTK